MERIIYRNELNQEIEFSYFSPYILLDFDDSLKNNVVSTKRVGGDGYFYAGSNLDTRDLLIRSTVLMRDGWRHALRKLQQTLNPKLRGKLIYINELYQKEIMVVLEELPRIKYMSNARVEISIDLQAFDSFWTEAERTEYLAFLTAKFHFPVIIPKATGMIFGIRKSILETEIENIGDVATGFRVIFKAKGHVRNVEVENKLTGEKLKVLVNMVKGDLVEIINMPGNKMIRVNGVKSFKSLDIDNSTFFDLQVGKNLIGYNAELNAVNLDVILYYQPLYLGR